MIRRAVIGSLAVVAIIVALFLALGFRSTEFRGLLSKPYEQALADGDYVSGLAVRVAGEQVPEVLEAELVLNNPTPHELRLDAVWDTGGRAVNAGSPGISAAVPPHERREMPVRFTVQRRGPVAEFRPPVLNGTLGLYETAPSGEGPWSAEAPFERPLVVRRSFGTANYGVLGAYLAAMLVIGLLAGRHIKGTRGFFIADGHMNYVLVGLSILGTYLSALTMMGLPGMSYGEHNWTYTVQLPCLILTAMVITGFVMRRYRDAGIVSVYEYLEQHIHVSARLMASTCFVIFAVGRMGLVLYLPALAFSTVTGAPLWLCIVAMGIVVTAYTVVGGMEAVIWTDAVQVVIFVIAAFLTLGYIFHDLGAAQFVDIGLQYGKFQVLKPGFDIREITTAWLILETIFQTIRIYGTQQDVAQRYMTTESTEKANRSVWIGILGYIPLGFIFYLIGTALFAFYKANPDVNLPGKADPMYPYFVVNHMPAGVAGLVIAAILAAAMSSIDSAMNSASTVCVEDFWKRFSRTERPDSYYLNRARRLTVMWGALAIVMGLLFMEISYAQIVWGKLMGISTNGILGLMALAFLPFRVNKWAAATGFAVSYVCLFAMMGAGINFLLWPVVGNLACFFVGLFTHPVFAACEARPAEAAS